MWQSDNCFDILEEIPQEKEFTNSYPSSFDLSYFTSLYISKVPSFDLPGNPEQYHFILSKEMISSILSDISTFTSCQTRQEALQTVILPLIKSNENSSSKSQKNLSTVLKFIRNRAKESIDMSKTLFFTYTTLNEKRLNNIQVVLADIYPSKEIEYPPIDDSEKWNEFVTKLEPSPQSRVQISFFLQEHTIDETLMCSIGCQIYDICLIFKSFLANPDVSLNLGNFISHFPFLSNSLLCDLCSSKFELGAKEVYENSLSEVRIASSLDFIYHLLPNKEVCRYTLNSKSFSSSCEQKIFKFKDDHQFFSIFVVGDTLLTWTSSRIFRCEFVNEEIELKPLSFRFPLIESISTFPCLNEPMACDGQFLYSLGRAGNVSIFSYENDHLVIHHVVNLKSGSNPLLPPYSKELFPNELFNGTQLISNGVFIGILKSLKQASRNFVFIRQFSILTGEHIGDQIWIPSQPISSVIYDSFRHVFWTSSVDNALEKIPSSSPIPIWMFNNSLKIYENSCTNLIDALSLIAYHIFGSILSVEREDKFNSLSFFVPSPHIYFPLFIEMISRVLSKNLPLKSLKFILPFLDVYLLNIPKKSTDHSKWYPQILNLLMDLLNNEYFSEYFPSIILIILHSVDFLFQDKFDLLPFVFEKLQNDQFSQMLPYFLSQIANSPYFCLFINKDSVDFLFQKSSSLVPRLMSSISLYIENGLSRSNSDSKASLISLFNGLSSYYLIQFSESCNTDFIIIETICLFVFSLSQVSSFVIPLFDFLLPLLQNLISIAKSLPSFSFNFISAFLSLVDCYSILVSRLIALFRPADSFSTFFWLLNDNSLSAYQIASSVQQADQQFFQHGLSFQLSNSFDDSSSDIEIIRNFLETLVEPEPNEQISLLIAHICKETKNSPCTLR